MDKLLLLAAAMCFFGMACADEIRPPRAGEMANAVPVDALEELAELDNNEMGGYWPHAPLPAQMAYGEPISVLELTADIEDFELGHYMRAATAEANNGVAPIARSVPNW